MRPAGLVRWVAFAALLPVPATPAPVPAPVPALVLRVAPDGTASGRDRLPTLSQALERAALLRRQDKDRAIVIELEPGTHRLAEPVRIGSEHSGTASAPLILRGAGDGASRLVGSIPLVSVPLPPALRARLPEVARATVRAYHLPEALRGESAFREPRRLGDAAPRVTEVFDRRGALRPAQWPNAGYAAASAAGNTRFGLHDAPLRALEPASDDLWAEGFWRWDWLNETLPIAKFDQRDGRFDLSVAPYDGILDRARIRLVHGPGLLDEPGEWWRDRASGFLLAWPHPDAPELEVSLADTLIAAEGARHVRIENLRLERTRRDLVTVRGGADIVIRRSELAWAAGRAAVFEDVAGGGVTGSAIHDIGATAVRLASGDRVNLLPGGLFLRDTRLTRFARLSQTQNPAVQVEGVGAQVTGNFFHDAVGYAVHLRGNDHLFARNEVARLMKGLSDSGAIYAGRDWTARGTAIRDNYVHDITPAPGFEVKGVYLDDMASGFTVERNLFVDVQQPVFIGGGSDNTIAENVFVSSNPAVTLDSRGETWMSESVGDPQSEIRGAYAAVPVASEVWRRRYPGLAGLLDREHRIARDNQIVGNFVIDGQILRSDGFGDPRRQIILLNTRLDGPAPRGDLSDLTGFAVARGAPLKLDPSALRRDGLPASPFSAGSGPEIGPR